MENFERVKVVGKGSYGEVWLSRHKKDKKQYVLKKMDLQKASKRERKAAEQEAKLLSKLKHPNIVAYKDSFETDDGYLWIAMGYCEGGDPYNHLKAKRGVLLDERQIVEWFVQISMALQYLHERNILHRDLKTQNIFLTRSKIIKLGDLGIARVLDSSNDMATTLIGTPYYMSPELFSNKPYNHKSDVWALGCCVYEMATLKHAFNAKDMNSLVYKILRGRMPPTPSQYSKDLTNLIRAMLDQNPMRRPSVNKILRDPFIKRNIAIFLEGTRKNRSVAAPSPSRPAVIDGVDASDINGKRSSSASSGKRRPASGGRRPDLIKTPVTSGKPRPFPEIPTPASDLPKSSNSEPASSTASSKSSKSEPATPISASKGSLSKMDEAEKTNPNMSARARRRERSLRDETPRNSYEGIHKIHLEPKRKGSADSERRGSAKSNGDASAGGKPVSRSASSGSIPKVKFNSNQGDKSDIVVFKDKQAESQAKGDNSDKNISKDKQKQSQGELRKRQPSMVEDEEEESSSVDNDDERERKRGEREMDNFVCALDATLHMRTEIEDDDDENVDGEDVDGKNKQQAAVEQINQQRPESAIRSPMMFSKETLNSSGRLMERIVALRKDCLKGVGLEKLHKAFQILDDIDSDNLEVRLLELLGASLFDEYAAKIWQLKFCEESAFRIS